MVLKVPRVKSAPPRFTQARVALLQVLSVDFTEHESKTRRNSHGRPEAEAKACFATVNVTSTFCSGTEKMSSLQNNFTYHGGKLYRSKHSKCFLLPSSRHARRSAMDLQTLFSSATTFARKSAKITPEVGRQQAKHFHSSSIIAGTILFNAAAWL